MLIIMTTVFTSIILSIISFQSIEGVSSSQLIDLISVSSLLDTSVFKTPPININLFRLVWISCYVIIALYAVGGASLIKYLCLRLILYLSGHIPWNYAKFLDYCAEIGLLRKVGGGYIFVHRYLLEYFAGLEEETP